MCPDQAPTDRGRDRRLRRTARSYLFPKGTNDQASRFRSPPWCCSSQAAEARRSRASRRSGGANVRAGELLTRRAVEVGTAGAVSFVIRQPDGQPLTSFRRGAGPHTGVHLIIVRRDLATIIHRHPPIAPNGTISRADDVHEPGPIPRRRRRLPEHDRAAAELPAVRLAPGRGPTRRSRCRRSARPTSSTATGSRCSRRARTSTRSRRRFLPITVTRSRRDGRRGSRRGTARSRTRSSSAGLARLLPHARLCARALPAARASSAARR